MLSQDVDTGMQVKNHKTAMNINSAHHCGQAYSKMNNIHTHITCLSVSVVEHGSKMLIEQF